MVSIKFFFSSFWCDWSGFVWFLRFLYSFRLFQYSPIALDCEARIMWSAHMQPYVFASYWRAGGGRCGMKMYNKLTWKYTSMSHSTIILSFVIPLEFEWSVDEVAPCCGTDCSGVMHGPSDWFLFFCLTYVHEMVAGEMPKSKKAMEKVQRKKIKVCNVNNINGDNIDNTTTEHTHIRAHPGVMRRRGAYHWQRTTASTLHGQGSCMAISEQQLGSRRFPAFCKSALRATTKRTEAAAVAAAAQLQRNSAWRSA